VLAAEVKALRSGEDWKRFLEFQSRLHAYSPNNVMLVYAQHAKAFNEGEVSQPFPGYVAGFNTWKVLGRSVVKGQHGYLVLAPLRGVSVVAVSDQNGKSVLRRLEKGRHRRRASRSRPA
jgi:N-terminal domain of anti-restriction factor ArdC